MKSMIQSRKECYLCRELFDGAILSDEGLHDHHIIFGHGFRSKSEEHGMKVWLCMPHHIGSDYSPHRNIEVDLKLKIVAQKKFEEKHTREEWIKEFGKSYIISESD